LMREMDRKRLDRGAGEATCTKAEPRLVEVEVDRHPDEGVDGAERVGPGRFHGAGDDPDVAYHRRELHPDRQARTSAHGLGDRSRGARIIAEVKAALLDVWARDVDLEPRDARYSVEHGREVAVLGRRLSVDVDENRKIPLRPLRCVVAQEGLGTGALQPDRVEHPARGLGDSRRRRALARAQEDSFGYHPTEGAPFEQGHLSAVAEGAGGREHWTAKSDRADRHRHVDAHAVTAYERCDGSADQSTSDARYTGPSLHARS